MISSDTKHLNQCIDENVTTSNSQADSPQKPKKSLSMHEDVPVWYDCCSCEAEPYWTASVEDQDSDLNDDS